MNNRLSQPAARVRSDFSYTLTEALHYLYMIELDGAGPADMACALIERAQNLVDDSEKTGWKSPQEDELDRTIRQMDFADYLASSAEKRLELLSTSDPELSRHQGEYRRIKNTIHMMYNIADVPEDEEPDYETTLGFIEEIEDELLSQGIGQEVLARVFADCAFICAKSAPVEKFIEFCTDLLETFGEDGTFEPVPDQGMNYAAGILLQALHIPSSSCIH
jgi:hypothetical protein